MNDSELTQCNATFMDRPFTSAGSVGGIGSWCHRKPCSGLDSNTGPNAKQVHD